MNKRINVDVIIVGGSYAGLSAAMALGRALRRVTVIDNGLPCNRQTPFSHNFLTQDGVEPSTIAQKAKQQVEAYQTVAFHTDTVVEVVKMSNVFQVNTLSKQFFTAPKIIFATGVKDIMPNIPGFSECWGVSVLHCPYCHGYEVRQEATGILANGDVAFHYAKLIRNWTKNLTIFTDGKSTLSDEQLQKLAQHGIAVIEKKIVSLDHECGMLQQIVFSDNSTHPVKAIYSRPNFVQHCPIPESLGCELTEQGLLKVDGMQKTTVPGIFACGDSTHAMRSVANAVATGNMAGAAANNELIGEAF